MFNYLNVGGNQPAAKLRTMPQLMTAEKLQWFEQQIPSCGFAMAQSICNCFNCAQCAFTRLCADYVGAFLQTANIR
jgi:hypothetical protein